ncbi:MAG TPA: DNA polymerase IV [Parcubacteria group bacterium]|nr:DNA polymerase IV [Parcubacteria group bacterium]
MQRAILHIDGDSFFASCEVALDPKLKGKPVVTGHERGIATAMSKEAKALGISRGMPVFMIKKLYPSAVIVESHYHIYGMFAQRMYDIVRRYTDVVEEYSIDECFADITHLGKPGTTYKSIAESIRKDLKKELGMTFSIGLGETKVLAKVASKWEKPDGLTIINKDNIQSISSKLQIGSVWGIGPSSTVELNRHNIRTVHDFVSRPQGYIESNFSRPIVETWHELRGTQVHHVSQSDESTDDQKSVQSTKSFGKASKDKKFLLSELSRNVERASAHARQLGLISKHIYIFLKTKEFRYKRVDVQLAQATASPTLIMNEVLKVFDSIYDEETLYRATGVTLANLVPENLIQEDLFGESEKKSIWKNIFEITDQLDRRYGSRTMALASSLGSMKVRGYKPRRLLNIPSMGETL